MRKIVEIIEIIRQHKNLKSEAQVAAAINMSQQALNKHKIRESYPYDQLIAFCEEEDLSLDWLLLGREPAQKEKEIGELRKLLKSVEKKLK